MPTVKVGRKRDEGSRLAVLSAAWDVTVESGFAALTVEGIATRAGVGKQTIYRWWPSKADVLLEALAEKADLEVTVEDHGSFRGDLKAFLADSGSLLHHLGVAAVLRVLMAEAQLDPEFKQRFQAGFIARRRAALSMIMGRAARRGDHPAVAGTDTLIDLVIGLIWYRLLVADGNLTATQIRHVLDTIAPPTPRENLTRCDEPS
jgi:AcrR family transcriptional regulator